MDRLSDTFWAPIDVRNPARSHRWTPIDNSCRSLCGLLYQAWNIGKPDEKLPKCAQCVKKIKQ